MAAVPQVHRIRRTLYSTAAGPRNDRWRCTCGARAEWTNYYDAASRRTRKAFLDELEAHQKLAVPSRED